MRTELYANPEGRFVHDCILEACRRNPNKVALVDTSLPEPRRVTYAEYADLVERLARSLRAAGLENGDRVALFLPNSWEFCAAYHAATLAGCIPTPLNPSYREREVRYQLENSGAAILIAMAPLVAEMNLSGLPALRRVFTTRGQAPGCSDFSELLVPSSSPLTPPTGDTREILAALPYSSGTTGLPKGVMLSHFNLVSNAYQIIGPDAAPFHSDEITLCFLPLYHIYGLNVVLNPTLMLGATLVLMPRFDAQRAAQLIAGERISFIPLVPPVLNAFCQLAEQGLFPRQHNVRFVKSGAAPLPPELARRFTSLTGIIVVQGYGMTEASPGVTLAVADGAVERPVSIGMPHFFTDIALAASPGSGRSSGNRLSV